MSRPNRKRDVPLFVWLRQEEYDEIQNRMAEAGIRNMSAYVRKMTLDGYVLHVDLEPVRELVSLQRRCSNNLNQVAVHAHTYGIYEHEIKALQKGAQNILCKRDFPNQEKQRYNGDLSIKWQCKLNCAFAFLKVKC